MKKLNFKNLMGGKMLLLAPVVIMVVGLLLILFSYVTEKDVKIVSMKVTNVSESSATVTWLSKTKDKGILVVSESNDFDILSSFSKARFYDERDQSSETLKERYTHQVKVTGLNPETKYYFRVTEGLKLTEYTYPALETAPILSGLATPDPSYGSIKTGEVGDDLIIYSRFKGSALGSSVVEANGSFSLDKTNYRTQTLDGRETYKDGDIIVFEVLTNEGVANYVVKIGEDKPFGLGELKDSLIKQTSLNKSLVSGVNAKEANDNDGGGSYESTSSASSSTSSSSPSEVTPEPAPACVPSCSNVQCGNMNSCGTGYCSSDCKAPEKPKTIESRPYENVSCDDLKDQCKEADQEACAEYGRKSCRTSETKLTAASGDARSESMKASGIPTTLEDCKSIKTKLEREECKANLDRDAGIAESIKNTVKGNLTKLGCAEAAKNTAKTLIERYPDKSESGFATSAYYACCEFVSCEQEKPATLKELCGSSGLEPKQGATSDTLLTGGPVPVYQDKPSLCKVTSLEDCHKINLNYTVYLNGGCYKEEDLKTNQKYLFDKYGETDKYCDEWYGVGEGKFRYVSTGLPGGMCVPKQTAPEICNMKFSGKPNWGTTSAPGQRSVVVSDVAGAASSIYVGVTADGKCVRADDLDGVLLLTKFGGKVTKEYCEASPSYGKGYVPNTNNVDSISMNRQCVKSTLEACPKDAIVLSSKGVCLTYDQLQSEASSTEDCQDRYNSKDMAFDSITKKCVPTEPKICNTRLLSGTYYDLTNYVKVENGKCISSKEIAERNMRANGKAIQSDCDGYYFRPGNTGGEFKPRDPLSISTEFCVPATIKGCEILNPGVKVIGVGANGECQLEIKNKTVLPLVQEDWLLKDLQEGKPINCDPNVGNVTCEQRVESCTTQKLNNNLIQSVNAANESGGSRCKVLYVKGSIRCASTNQGGTTGLCVGISVEETKYPSEPSPSSSSSTSSKGALNGNPIKAVNAIASVLGVSDGNDTSVKVDEKGTYKVSLNDSNVALLSNKFSFTEGDLTGKFFLDKNLNGVKDSGEEYYKDELSLKVEKVGDLETYNLVSGWNLIGWNFAKSDVLTAKDFLVRVARSGGYATHMATYRNGEWKELSLRGDSEFGTNFSLLPTEGYFVKVITPAKVVIEGTKIEKTDQVYVINGWNLMSFRPTKVTLASSMIDSVNSSQKYTVDTVTKFESGRYENLVKDSTTTYGKDFNLEENKGYFIRALKGALVKKN